MLMTYVVVVLAYIFAACAGAALIVAMNHLDPAEAASEQAARAHEPKLAA
jgi:hypothetical protein